MIITLAAFMAIVGHIFPLWLRFKGGKGVATAIGAFAMLAPAAAGLSLLTFAIVVGLSRIVSLSSIVAAAVFPWYWWQFSSATLLGTLRHTVSDQADVRLTAQRAVSTCLALVIASSSLVILKHRANIRRLLNGTEPKFGMKKPAIPPDPIQVEKNA
jgi:glycerol-3-phosphate acyltransferase PlsY